MEVIDAGRLFALLGPIAGTWAAFQLAMLLRRREQAIRESWHVFGYVLNMLGGFGLMIHLVHTLVPRAAWAVAAAFGVLYIACAWLFQTRARRVLYLMSATIGLLALAVVSPLRLGLGNYWVPTLRLFGIELVILAGVLLKERYFRVLGYLAFLYTLIEVLFLKTDPVLVTVLGLGFHHRILLLSGTSLFGFLNAFLTRRTWRRSLTDSEVPGIFYSFSGAGAAALLFLIWMEVQDIWIAPTLGGLSLVGVLLANRLALKDFVIEASGFALAALVAIVGYDLQAPPTPSGVPLRPLALGLVALALVLAYVHYRFRIWTSADQAYTAFPKPAAIVTSVVASVVIGLLVTRDVPSTWVAPSLAAITVACFWLALHRNLEELLYEGMAFTLVAVGSTAYFSWPLAHRVLGLPARPVSVGLVLVLLYVAHQVLEGFIERKPSTASPALIMGDWPTFARVTTGYLTLATVLLGWLVKAEAMVYDKNLLVALILGLIGVVYLEVAKLKTSKAWYWHGHIVLVVATVHLFLEDSTAAIELTPRQRTTRYFYLYDMVAVAAVLMMYELMRAWVIVGWTALGVALLLRWQKTRSSHWRLCALILGIAALARSFAVNLYYRDETADVHLSAVVRVARG